MLILIVGENGSGKSTYAEKLVCTIEQGKRYYIATMQPYGEEGAARVIKHIKQREGMRFETIEKQSGIGDIDIDPNSTVLLEDASNLLANIIFGAQNENGAEAALNEISELNSKCRNLVVVTISGLSGDGYDSETQQYVNSLNFVNDELFKLADTVYELSGSLPILTKGTDINEND